MTPFEIAETFKIHFELIENISKIVENGKAENASALSEMQKKIDEQSAQIAELTKIFNEKIQTLQLSRALLIAGELRKHPELSQATIAARFGVTAANVCQISKRYGLRKPKEQSKTQPETPPTVAAPAGAQF